MFKLEGAARTDRQNRVLAGYLASVAGYVNAVGFVVAATFTSHVTGNVGRMIDEGAQSHLGAALSDGSLVVAFFCGAFLASIALESRLFGRIQYTYGFLLFAEAAALGGSFHFARRTAPIASPSEAMALLAFAMGLQNSLVTRLSGAVVRTTHLTGIVTDLGIEAARWVRFIVRRLGAGKAAERPHVPKVALLATIFCSFLVGGAAGALFTHAYSVHALLLPIALLTLGGSFAIRTGRVLVGDDSRR